MQANFVSYSSSVGRLWVHLAFKVKYSHRIFAIPGIKTRCEALLRQALSDLHIHVEELGIDMNHVHFVLDIGITPIAEIVKKLKGFSAKRLFQEYPWLKKKYFWNSGLWNPSYYFDSLGRNLEEIKSYVRQQGQPRTQKSVLHYLGITN